MTAIPESHRPASSGARTGLTRRGVVRAAAWSVPAVTIATAAPAYAASEPTDELTVALFSSYDTQAKPPYLRLGVRLAPVALVGSSHEASPVAMVTIVISGAWPAGSTMTLIPGQESGVPVSSPGWDVVEDSTTSVAADGTVTSTTGTITLRHQGGLTSSEGTFAVAGFTVLSNTAFLTDSPPNLTASVTLVEAPSHWRAGAAASVDAENVNPV